MTTEFEVGPDGHVPTEMESGPDARSATELDGDTGPGASQFVAPTLPDELARQVRIVSRIAGGGQGSVYLAERLDNGEAVAVKLYPIEKSRLDESVMRLIESAPADHIVPTHFGQWHDLCWEIQEYMPLGTLTQIQDRVSQDLPHEFTQSMVSELAEAVQAAHELNLLHRDIKPSNVLIRTLEPVLDLVLADFGLTRQLLAGAEVGTRSATPGYRSPETAEGVHQFSSDWWQVGITLFEVLCGRHPFDDENGYRRDDVWILGHLIHNEAPLDGVTNPRWKLLLSGLLTKSPDHRWGITEVREWLAGESPTVHKAVAGPTRSFEFVDAGLSQQRFDSMAELGHFFAANWDEAGRYLTGDGLNRLHNMLAQTPTAGVAEQIFDRYKKGLITTDALVFELVRLLTPTDPLSFRGRLLNGDELVAVATSAADGSQTTRSGNWIRKMREGRILANTLGHPDHAQLTLIDSELNEWWREISARVEEMESGRSAYFLEQLGSGAELESAKLLSEENSNRLEGELLLAVLSDERTTNIHQEGQAQAKSLRKSADWIRPLAEEITKAKEPTPHLDMLLLTLASTATGDISHVRRSLNNRTRAAAAADLRARRTASLGPTLPRVALGLIYLVGVGLAAVLPYINRKWDNLDTLENVLSVQFFIDILTPTVVGIALAIAIAAIVDRYLIRPEKLAMVAAGSIALIGAWSFVVKHGLETPIAGKPWGGAAVPPIALGLAYIVSGVVSTLGQPAVSRGGPWLSTQIGGWERRLYQATTLLWLTALPLAVVETYRVLSPHNHLILTELSLKVIDAMPSWVTDAANWLDGFNRVSPDRTAWWVVPCLIVGWLTFTSHQLFRGGGSFGRREAATRINLVFIGLAAAGMAFGIIDQWTIWVGSLVACGQILLLLLAIRAFARRTWW